MIGVADFWPVAIFAKRPDERKMISYHMRSICDHLQAARCFVRLHPVLHGVGGATVERVAMMIEK